MIEYIYQVHVIIILEILAWTHLSEAVYKSESPFSWRGHSWITMSVDNRGLWVRLNQNFHYTVNDNSVFGSFLMLKAMS